MQDLSFECEWILKYKSGNVSYPISASDTGKGCYMWCMINYAWLLIYVCIRMTDGCIKAWHIVCLNCIGLGWWYLEEVYWKALSLISGSLATNYCLCAVSGTTWSVGMGGLI